MPSKKTKKKHALEEDYDPTTGEVYPKGVQWSGPRLGDSILHPRVEADWEWRWRWAAGEMASSLRTNFPKQDAGIGSTAPARENIDSRAVQAATRVRNIDQKFQWCGSLPTPVGQTPVAKIAQLVFGQEILGAMQALGPLASIVHLTPAAAELHAVQKSVLPLTEWLLKFARRVMRRGTAAEQTALSAMQREATALLFKAGNIYRKSGGRFAG
jgi:hypothetical protein